MPYIITRPDLKWYYQLKGNGEPLLFIHGWSGNLTIWQEQTDFFAKNFQTIALDLPGHGKSSWQKSSLNELASDINFILDKIELKKVTIITASLGGLIALKFALMFPERLERLILIGSAAKFVSDDKKDGITLSQIEKLSTQLETDYVGALLTFARSLASVEERKRMNFQKVWKILSHMEALPRKNALQDFLKILKDEDLSQILPIIGVNTLIISGEKDFICGKEKVEQMCAKMPRACLRFIKNGGHIPYLTQPEVVNRILNDFLLYGKVD